MGPAWQATVNAFFPLSEWCKGIGRSLLTVFVTFKLMGKSALPPAKDSAMVIH